MGERVPGREMPKRHAARVHKSRVVPESAHEICGGVSGCVETGDRDSAKTLHLAITARDETGISADRSDVDPNRIERRFKRAKAGIWADRGISVRTAER